MIRSSGNIASAGFLVIVLLMVAVVLTSCGGQRPPLRYIATERHYHHLPRANVYSNRYDPAYDRRDAYAIRREYYSRRDFAPFEGTQMRREMVRQGVMYGNGCYPQWCGHGS